MDAQHLLGLGYDLVRLGVTWAGAQLEEGGELDPAWLDRLHAFLDLCHDQGLYVLLDVHQDAVGTATCGEGVPMWVSQLAVPDEIGEPIWPLPDLVDGTCGRNDTEGWAQYRGDVNYNIRNECCRKRNQGPWGDLITTTQAQKTMAFLFSARGRAHYVDFVGKVHA